MTLEKKRVPWRDLHKFVTDVFESAELPPDDAVKEADCLVWANLRGVDSHGVLRIPWYLHNIAMGIMNPRPRITVVKETPSTTLIDADRALGPVVTVSAVDRAVQKAHCTGIGLTLIRNHTHQGAIGYYSHLVAEARMAGIVIACNPPNMAPYGARVAGLHNSPIAIAVPVRQHSPLILDMATSVAAGGKLWLAQEKGNPIPEGWALDSEGNSTTDPNTAAAFLPVGGPKGSGLALLFECLTSVLVGNPLVEPTLSGRTVQTKAVHGSCGGWTPPKYLPQHNQNSLVLAIDVSAFSALETYADNVDSLIDAVKGLPKALGFQEILVPGEMEARIRDDRMRDGIPLPNQTINNLRSVGAQYNVNFPT